MVAVALSTTTLAVSGGFGRMAKVGRPSKFSKQMCGQVTKLCRLGATDKELADFFEVAESTVHLWKQQHPEFSESLQKGKVLADAEVAEKLYQRAIGYTHPEEKVFCNGGEIVRAETTRHYPPDTAAAFIWLKNRRSDSWRDRVEHTGKDGGPIEYREMSDMELARRMVSLLDKATTQTH